MKTQDAQGVTIQIRYYETRWYAAMLGSEYISDWISGDTDWTYYHKDLTVPSNTNYFDILLITETPDVGTSYAWFDNVGLIEWNDWKFQASDPIISNPNDYYFYQVRTDEQFANATVKYVETAYGPMPQVETDEQPEQDFTISHVMNYPNPFYNSTQISFSSKENIKDIAFKIYNIKGQLIRELHPVASSPSLSISVTWDAKDSFGKNAANGIYFYTISSGNNVLDTQKCVLLR